MKRFSILIIVRILLVVTNAMILAWIFGLAAYGPLDAEFTVQHLAYRVLPQACAVWGLVTVVLAIVVQVLRTRVRAAVR